MTSILPTPGVVDTPYLTALLDGAAQTARELIVASAALLGTRDHRALMRAALGLIALDLARAGEDAGAAGGLASQAATSGIVTADPATTDLLAAAEVFVARVAALQNPSGLFSSEGNLDSPPDTAFTINDLAAALALLDSGAPHDSFARRWQGVRATLERIGRSAAPALAVGGVHTPNHRWELASSLAALHSRWPELALAERAEAWLAEGIDIDADGLYSERSGIYAAEVTNPSLLSLARDLDHPELVDLVARNLRATVALIEDDGEVENVHSRRQDQRLAYDAELYLSPLRQLALRGGEPEFVRLAQDIVRRGLRHPARHLAEALRHPELLRPLPTPAPRPVDSTVAYPVSGLLRVRRGDLSASVFGGSDYAATGRIASGLANSATLVRARRGGVVLRSVRVAPTFFSMGCLRPRLTVTEHGALLAESRTSGYYEPLAPDAPRDLTRPVYEGRYFASMDFARRVRDTLELTSVIEVEVTGDGVELTLSFSGAATRYAVELVFDGEATVSGARALGGAWWLTDGSSTVATSATEGNHAVVSAEGFDDVEPDFDDGEMFGYVGGSDAIAGTRVLLSGSTATPARIRIDFPPR